MDGDIPDPTETDRLLRQAQAGDPQAMEELFARHAAYLRQVIGPRLDKRLRARVDVSDVVQETQIEVFRRLEEYLRRQPMPFRLWLRKTACECLGKLHAHHLGAAKRSLRCEVVLPERSSLQLAGRLLRHASTPSKEVSRREIARLVNLAVAELPDADREVLLMRHSEGLAYDEVSTVLEITPEAARKRYGRALLRLQKLLEQSGLLEWHHE
jgi:RNA polymerase sigma-70 factor (ECF subfamily)